MCPNDYRLAQKRAGIKVRTAIKAGGVDPINHSRSVLRVQGVRR